MLVGEDVESVGAKEVEEREEDWIVAAPAGVPSPIIDAVVGTGSPQGKRALMPCSHTTVFQTSDEKTTPTLLRQPYFSSSSIISAKKRLVVKKG